MSSKFTALATALNAKFEERSQLVDGMIVALLAREMLFMLGSPGTGKSDVCGALCSALGGNYFSWLMSKFTTPEEIYGPYSLKALQNDSYRRVTKGKLPEADIGFLDETFKGSSAILNTLLPVINERVFYNDGVPTKIPLQTIFGASNEIPQAEELAALYDRFALRYVVNRIQTDSAARALFSKITSNSPAPSLPSISLDELRAEQAAAEKVSFPQDVMDTLVTIRRSVDEEGIYVSDRRWVQAIRILKANAHYQGSNAVESEHLDILKNVLWSTTDQQKLIARLINKYTNPLGEKISELADSVTSVLAEFKAGKMPAAEAQKKITMATKRMESLGDVATNKKLAAEVKRLKVLNREFCEKELGLQI